MNSPGPLPGIQYRMNKSNKKSNKTNPKTPRQPTVMKVPVAYGMNARSTPPRVNGKDNFHVSRREFVGTVTNGAVTTFGLTPLSTSMPGYDINPSVYNMFPWLSNIANCYERFRFNRLAFHFLPSQATSTAGRFYAAVDYDYDDNPALTKTEMMGNKTAVESPVWNECRLECDPQSLNRDLPYRYVSCSTRGLEVEGRTAFSGFLMCAFDTPTANCLMDLWVEYDVELVTPVNESVSQQFSSAADAYATASTATTAGAGPYYGFPNATKNVTTGTVRVVTPGTATTPAMTILGLSVPKALDIMDAKGRGFLDLLTSVNATGQTPASLLTAAKALNISWEAFDSTGTWIASLTQTPAVFPTSSFSHVLGCDVGKNDIAGEYVRSVTSFAIDTILSYRSNVRYLVPMLTNAAAAIGAGYSAWGFRYKN